MKKLLTLVFAIALSSAMLAQDAPTTGTTPTSPTATPSTDASATQKSKTNKTIKRRGQHSKGKRQQVKTENGASEQREMRTNGKIEQRRETKTLKNGKVVTRKQQREVK